MINSKLDEELISKNILLLCGEIDDNLSNKLISQASMIYMRMQNTFVPKEKQKITVVINSPGGCVNSGFAILDFLKSLKVKLEVIVIGKAFSMAAFLLAVLGEKGARFACPHAEIMIHQPLSGISGQATDLMLHAEHIGKIKQKLNDMLSQATGMSVETVSTKSERDFFMTPNEAKELGLIDDVITDISYLFKE